MKALAAIALIAAGCAADPVGWDAAPTRVPLPSRVIYSTAQEINEVCGPYATACAHRDERVGLCTIFIERNPIPGTMAHELKHCAGYSHACFDGPIYWTIAR